MSVHDYSDLAVHVGHEIVCVSYAGGANVALECEGCGVVLLDYDRPSLTMRSDGRWEVDENDPTRGCRKDGHCILADGHDGGCEEDREAPDPNRRYEMFTVEGNAACAELVDRVVRHIQDMEYPSLTALVEVTNLAMESLARNNGHEEVFDTEPRNQIHRELVARVCEPNEWKNPWA